MRIEFSPDQIRTRIRLENPWWQAGKVDDFFLRMRRREYFNLFQPLVLEEKVRRAIVLMGPRRVGKTVLIFHSIQNLLESGVNGKNVCYLSIETPLFNGISLEELLNIYLTEAGSSGQARQYVFFDEIQYLKDWEVHLKSLVDTYRNVKFIVSGSAAAALKLKSNESGAGRFTDFKLPPLTFHEYLTLTNQGDLISSEPREVNKDGVSEFFKTTDIGKLNEHFVRYINYGGYPEVSLSPEIQKDPGRYIKNDIVDKVLLRDLPSLYGIQDNQELNTLFTYLAYHSGNEMSLEGISRSSDVSKNTIKKYLSYLEAAFLIKIVNRIDHSAKKFKRANFFKVFLTNPSLRGALFAPIADGDDFMGNMVETAIFSQWWHDEAAPLLYARWERGEVDIVSLEGSTQRVFWCVEVKWSDRFPDYPGELKSVKQFCLKNKLTSAVVTTRTITRRLQWEGIDLDFLPSALYCYSVGRNLVEGRRDLQRRQLSQEGINQPDKG
ncbi:MAG: ATP-binding protein [Cyclobacteriaceae bacterium]|nr:ATP-binding protein [Cyclobacteriaceae bacterium]